MKVKYNLIITDEDKLIQAGFYDAWVEEKTKTISKIAKENFKDNFKFLRIKLKNKMVKGELTPVAQMTIIVVGVQEKDILEKLNNFIVNDAKR